MYKTTNILFIPPNFTKILRNILIFCIKHKKIKMTMLYPWNDMMPRIYSARGGGIGETRSAMRGYLLNLGDMYMAL